MGSVYNRGTRSKPNWYVSYKKADGKRKAISSRQPTKALARRFLEHIEARIANGLLGIEPPETKINCGQLLTEWSNGLYNRSARDDQGRIRNHLMPEFGDLGIEEITLPRVMKWLDKQRATGKLAEPTMRTNLNMLSRFFSWAIERGMTQVNPVRMIPIGKRPKRGTKKDVAWLEDDSLVVKLIDELPEPANYMFYLGNRSGMRTGEIAGIRMSDFAYLQDGVIRVRYSYDGPLKEDRDNTGKTKWVPAADDCAEFLAPWLNKRKATGVGPEEFVFPRRTDTTRPYSPKYCERRWNKARAKFDLQLTWYQATRHSFASRLLSAGATLDEVSAALGHSSPLITRRHYDHFIRRSYSSAMRGGLDLGTKKPSADS